MTAQITEYLRQPSLSTDNLAAIVEEFAENPASWLDAVRFNVGGRWWARLHSDDLLDVWLITWTEDTGTELHDHGDSAGAFIVISGTLTEVRPARGGGLFALTTLKSDDVRAVEPGAIHDVTNPSRTPAISIHAYSPPLRKMTYYKASEHLPVPIRTLTLLDGSEP
jgi:mannose-6-phosphate isomerase-like protein (cupin superfamily)